LCVCVRVRVRVCVRAVQEKRQQKELLQHHC